MAGLYDGLARATGGFDFNAAAAATDTVTVGDQTYTFVSSLSSADDVLVGTDLDESITHLVAAINGDADESGDGYHADTAESPYVTAEADLTDDEVDLTAKVPGTVSNGIFLGTSETDIVVTGGETELTGGTGRVDELFENMLSNVQLNSEAIDIVRFLSSDPSD